MSTETKVAHTPGPWRLDPEGLGLVLDSDGSAVITAGPNCLNDTGEAYANARLIAAAPELYALLQRVANHFAFTDAPLGLDAAALLARIDGETL